MSPYGVIANLLAMPIVSVMPMGILDIVFDPHAMLIRFLKRPLDPQRLFSNVQIGPAKRQDLVAPSAGECCHSYN